MSRELTFAERVERSLITTYRKELWKPFILAVKRYELIQAGDKIAVCISGGKDSMLMAKLMQELQAPQPTVPFEAVFLVMDPGYNEINRPQDRAATPPLLDIPDHHLRDEHLRGGQRQRKEPLLPVRPDAPGLPVQQGQGAGLQQDCRWDTISTT